MRALAAIIIWHDVINLIYFPDRPFHNFRVSKSVERWALRYVTARFSGNTEELKIGQYGM